MLKLEDIKEKSHITGVIPNESVEIISVNPVGTEALTVTYKTASGELHEQMLFRDNEADLTLSTAGRAWSFKSPAKEFRLALEALRISKGFQFDPLMAIHTSNVEPLPHQIAAVYEKMLPLQPLRFILADDPGAGKTIMAGLLIKELVERADAQRVLIVAPGSLTEQWQDELWEKFTLQFKLFNWDQQNASASGNYFEDENYLIARIDQLSRNEDLQAKLRVVNWDLVIVDEAHKMAAHYNGDKLNKTKRYNLGELLGKNTRHFLLMTATPHNGKDADFQAFLALLDSDRFYGESRNTPRLDISDVMRRMVKEELLRFDGTRLFPERRAISIKYTLSDAEAALYNDVTRYVVEEMNRADRLDSKRKGQVGFALTMLQRRLASSPAAIYKSLQRRRERMEKELREKKLAARGEKVSALASVLHEAEAEYTVKKTVSLPDDFDEWDDELTSEEYENLVENAIGGYTAAKNIPEMEAEVESLRALELRAKTVVDSGVDCKWMRMSELLQDKSQKELYDASGARRKMIIFTEHRDTLEYLQGRISGLLGNPEAVRVIHGGTGRDSRKMIQEDFCNNPDVIVLIATDAAGEGVNLQKANLMFNYDLPWNPNRIEQRFGRIHRIGQTEICHLWNMVAWETREGDVFFRLFEKLENERQTLGGQVFDILGDAFDDMSLKDLLIKAIREGETPDAKKWMTEKVESTLNTEHLREIIRRNALVEQAMSMEDLYKVKEEMDKAEARKLQPHFVQAFFLSAFAAAGGTVRNAPNSGFSIPNVPSCIRQNDRIVGRTRIPVAKKYERICFDKQFLRARGNSTSGTLMHPGHPLLAALTDYICLKYRHLLKPGTIMLDPADDCTEPSLLFLIQHTVQESQSKINVSERLQFVRVHPDGTVTNAGYAPHLDLQEPDDVTLKIAEKILEQPWLNQDLEKLALSDASVHLAKDHYLEIKKRRTEQADRIQAAVRERLVHNINYYSQRAIELDEEVKAGRQPRVQPENMRRTVDELTTRLQNREQELTQMRNVVSNTPVVSGGILVIPRGLVNKETGAGTYCADATARREVELLAMQKVMDTERAFGYEVKDVSADKCGWDVTSQPPVRPDGTRPAARHIEVKGRTEGATTVTVSYNEVLSALNQGDKFILALVSVENGVAGAPRYVRRPFSTSLDECAASTNYDLGKLLNKAVAPEETL